MMLTLWLHQCNGHVNYVITLDTRSVRINATAYYCMIYNDIVHFLNNMLYQSLFFLLTLSLSLPLSDSHRDLKLGLIQVNPETKRLVDQFGREVFFHGVNVVYKIPPYVPRTDAFDPVHSFVEKDMHIISNLGFNVIRLGLMWPGAEPHQQQFNQTYFDTIRSIIDKAYQYGIYTILDMHQDVMAEQFCGEGVPAWAIRTGNAPPFPFPLSSSSDHENSTDCGKHQWANYYIAEAVGVAFQNIYDNKDEILDYLAAFWDKAANEFKDRASVLGYELINEPWLGDLYHHPSLIDPGIADVTNLAPVYEKLSAAIRRVDSSHLILFEPVTWADLGTGFKQVPGGELYQNRSVLSYHYYVPPDAPFVKEQFDVRMQDLHRLKCGGFLTEFAICGDKTKLMEEILNACDEHKQSWTGWMYKLYGNITGDCGALFDPLTGELDQKRADLLSRSYPMVVAGSVDSISFNSLDSEFELVYTTREDVKYTETVIYVNSERRYANNPTVTVTTNLKHNVTRNGNYVVLTHDLADKQVIKVNITPP